MPRQVYVDGTRALFAMAVGTFDDCYVADQFDHRSPEVALQHASATRTAHLPPFPGPCEFGPLEVVHLLLGYRRTREFGQRLPAHNSRHPKSIEWNRKGSPTLIRIGRGSLSELSDRDGHGQEWIAPLGCPRKGYYRICSDYSPASQRFHREKACSAILR